MHIDRLTVFNNMKRAPGARYGALSGACFICGVFAQGPGAACVDEGRGRIWSYGRKTIGLPGCSKI